MPTTARPAEQGTAEVKVGKVDWDRVCRTTDAEIAEQIASDPDTAPDGGNATDWRIVYNPPVPDVQQIRRQLGLSQAAFARRFGFRVRTVQQWEQGRAAPSRPVRLLLRLIERAPETVERVLFAS